MMFEYCIKDIGKVITGKTPKTAIEENFGSVYPFITPRDMNGEKYTFSTERYLSELGKNSVKNMLLPSNSVCVSCIGSDMGKVTKTTCESVTNQQINSIIVNEKIAHHDYVYYDLVNRRDELRLKAAGGTALPIINKSTFENLNIYLPSLQEQKRIADILSSLDDKIALNREMNKTLEAMAQAIFKSWFVDFEPFKEGEFIESELGMIPKGWESGKLVDIVNIFDSKRVPLSGNQREKMKGEYPYYGAATLMDYVNDYLFDGIYLLMGEDGSVTNSDGTPILQYVWGKIWVNNHAHVLQGKEYVATEWLYLFLKDTNITAFVTGAVQAKLNQSNLFRIPCIIAPQDVMTDFRKKIDSLFSKIRFNQEEITTLTILRDTLLPKLLSGEIEV